MGNDRRIRDEHNDRTMVERIDPLMGTVFANRYRIDFRLASGGFGAIYRATDVETKQQFALKVLHAEMATADGVIARFRREWATLEQLKDPHTIAAYELGQAPDGSLYIVMELLHGESLYEQFRAKGPLPWQRVVTIGRQVCSSLAEAHALGIIHRDLKPANIHVENRDGNPDFVKVLDFGIAKIMRDSELDSTELTQAGQMIGTFDYMAPEQMVGGQCTGRTDIYTLGIVLYEMVSGHRPFAEASSPTAMLAALLTQSPASLDVPGMPSELERILMKCLEREPQNRYEDVGDLMADLDRMMRPIEEGVTKRMNATPAPILVDEATVVAQPRPKRGSQPHVMRRDEAPAVTVEHRPKRPSEPPRQQSWDAQRRDGSSPAIPVGERAKRPSSPANRPTARDQGSGPVPVLDQRAKRESVAPNVIRRNEQSQPVPLVPSQDPGAWQSLGLPKRNDQVQAAPVRHDLRDSQQVPVLPAHAYAQNPPTAPPSYAAGSYPAIDPAQPYGAYPQQSVPTPVPHVPSQPYVMPHAPIPHTPTPPPYAMPHAPMPHTPTPPYVMQNGPIPHTPTPDPRLSLPPMRPSQLPQDPNWRGGYPQAPRASTYDMAGNQSRDVVVRRVVWTIAIVLGVILAVVVASRL